MKPENKVFQFPGNHFHFPSKDILVLKSFKTLKGLFARAVIRSLVNLNLVLLSVLPKRRMTLKEGRKTVLLTGTFYSENWIMNHLRPLLQNESSKAIYMVCYFPITPCEKLHVIHPPKVFKVLGKTGGRLVYFCWVALKIRPDLIGGFHILMNGLVVAVLGRILNIPTIYFCGGGPREVAGGGYFAGNASLNLQAPDYKLERSLIRSIKHIHHVVAMGQRTVKFFEKAEVKTKYHVIPGGIDQINFADGETKKEYDLVFVGRLVPVKRVDLFLKAVQILAQENPMLKALVVGSGELEDNLKKMAETLNIQKHVEFAGHQKDVANLLQRSKIFVLTSDSEGLSLAMMEALTCGLPCVVSDVGELGEIIEDNVNGFLVQERTGEAFAEKIRMCLADPTNLVQLSTRAKQCATVFSLRNTSRKWDHVLNWDPNGDPEPKQFVSLLTKTVN